MDKSEIRQKELLYLLKKGNEEALKNRIIEEKRIHAKGRKKLEMYILCYLLLYLFIILFFGLSLFPTVLLMFGICGLFLFDSKYPFENLEEDNNNVLNFLLVSLIFLCLSVVILLVVAFISLIISDITGYHGRNIIYVLFSILFTFSIFIFGKQSRYTNNKFLKNNKESFNDIKKIRAETLDEIFFHIAMCEKYGLEELKKLKENEMNTILKKEGYNNIDDYIIDKTENPNISMVENE